MHLNYMTDDHKNQGVLSTIQTSFYIIIVTDILKNDVNRNMDKLCQNGNDTYIS